MMNLEEAHLLAGQRSKKRHTRLHVLLHNKWKLLKLFL